MTGQSTAIAQAEMHRLAEEATPKVRKELVRLGCQDEITVKREDVSLRLIYHGRSMVLQPHILLTILERIASDRKPEQVWAWITEEIEEYNQALIRKLGILIMILLLAYFSALLLSQL